MEKKCNRCLEIKPFEEFSGNIRNKDGRLNTCLLCMRDYSLYYRQRKAGLPTTKEIIPLPRCVNVKTSNKKSPLSKQKKSCRIIVCLAYKRYLKNKNAGFDYAENLLGCEMAVFVKHIQSMFIDGMTPENHGLWHIDHIKPLALCKRIDDIKIFTHYKNLQPLWDKDNLKKSAKYNI